MNDNKGGNSGFLLGLIIGGAAVFLLGTDKGRKILKSLTEEGFGELSEFIERAEEEIEEAEEEEVGMPTKPREVVEKKTPTSNGHVSEPATKRRFFRRSPKS